MTRNGRLLSCGFFLLTSFAALAQMNTPLPPKRIDELARACAPRVHPDTIHAIIGQESASYPYSLSINYPHSEASNQGYRNSAYQLARQPRTLHEALTWTRWFVTHGHSVSIGLMQINSQETRALGLNNIGLLFDPCVNVAAGAVLLQESYRNQPPTLSGLSNAFSFYNSGSPVLGIENGYAAGVLAHAPPLRTVHPHSSSLSNHNQRPTKEPQHE
jgi:type IV secretion system protein VirB1